MSLFNDILGKVTKIAALEKDPEQLELERQEQFLRESEKRLKQPKDISSSSGFLAPPPPSVGQPSNHSSKSSPITGPHGVSPLGPRAPPPNSFSSSASVNNDSTLGVDNGAKHRREESTGGGSAGGVNVEVYQETLQDAQKWWELYQKSEKEKEQLQSNVHQLQRRLRDSEDGQSETCQQLKERIGQLEDSLHDAHSTIEAKDLEMNNVMMRLHTAEIALQDRQNEFDDLLQRLDRLQTIRDQTDSERKLQDELSNAYRLLTETEGRLNSAQSELVFKSRDLEKLRIKSENDNMVLAQALETIETKEKALLETQNTLRDFERIKAEESHRQKQRFEDEIRSLQRALLDLQARRATEMAQFEAALARERSLIHQKQLDSEVHSPPSLKGAPMRRPPIDLKQLAADSCPCPAFLCRTSGWSGYMHYAVAFLISLLLLTVFLRPSAPPIEQCLQLCNRTPLKHSTLPSLPSTSSSSIIPTGLVQPLVSDMTTTTDGENNETRRRDSEEWQARRHFRQENVAIRKKFDENLRYLRSNLRTSNRPFLSRNRTFRRFRSYNGDGNGDNERTDSHSRRRDIDS